MQLAQSAAVQRSGGKRSSINQFSWLFDSVPLLMMSNHAQQCVATQLSS